MKNYHHWNTLSSNKRLWKWQFQSVIEMIRNALDKGNFACGAFIDLQKALDTVSHHILLSKLNYYPSKHLLVLKTSSKHLQSNNFSPFSSSKTSWRRLENVLEDKKCYTDNVLKTSSRYVFKTSSRHVFKTFSRCLLGMFYWEYLLLNNPKSVSDKFVSHISECKMH